MSIYGIRRMFNDDWYGCGEDFEIDYSKSEDNQWWLARHTTDYVFTATELSGAGVPLYRKSGLLINLTYKKTNEIIDSLEWNPEIDGLSKLKSIIKFVNEYQSNPKRTL
jgi:hypothetical protein